MHDARQPAAKGKQDVQPEMKAEAHLKEHAKRRQDEGEQDADDIQRVSPGCDFGGVTRWMGDGFSGTAQGTFIDDKGNTRSGVMTGPQLRKLLNQTSIANSSQSRMYISTSVSGLPCMALDIPSEPASTANANKRPTIWRCKGTMQTG